MTIVIIMTMMKICGESRKSQGGRENIFCKNCGREIDDYAVVCPFCGVATGRHAVQQAPQTGSNGFVIAGFVLSFFFSLLGLIFSIVGLRKVSECGSGKGLAVAGIVFSIVRMGLYRITIASASCAAAALM